VVLVLVRSRYGVRYWKWKGCFGFVGALPQLSGIVVASKQASKQASNRQATSRQQAGKAIFKVNRKFVTLSAPVSSGKRYVVRVTNHSRGSLELEDFADIGH